MAENSTRSLSDEAQTPSQAQMEREGTKRRPLEPAKKIFVHLKKKRETKAPTKKRRTEVCQKRKTSKRASVGYIGGFAEKTKRQAKKCSKQIYKWVSF